MEEVAEFRLHRRDSLAGGLTTMPEIRAQIMAEIKRVRTDIDAQKRVIRHNTSKSLVIQEAEQELKQLHTRLGVLEANLKKSDLEPEGEPA